MRASCFRDLLGACLRCDYTKAMYIIRVFISIQCELMTLSLLYARISASTLLDGDLSAQTGRASR